MKKHDATPPGERVWAVMGDTVDALTDLIADLDGAGPLVPRQVSSIVVDARMQIDSARGRLREAMVKMEMIA